MTRYSLDTDVVIELLRGNKKILGKLKSLSRDTIISITGLTVYELYKGIIYMGDEKRKLEAEDFMSSVEILQMDIEAEKKAAEIYADLRKKGKMLNDADLLIAATVMVNNSSLVTNNTEHFNRIKGLKLENWL